MKKILPHEKDMLHHKLADGLSENEQAAIDMKNAIENGNQWHDNSEYDEAIERMKRIDSIYGPVSWLINNCMEVGYPDREEDKVTIGSLIEVQQNSEQFSVLMVGQSLTGFEAYEKAWDDYHSEDDDLYIVTPDSPLGQSMENHVEGDIVSYMVDSRSFEVKIISVNQNWLRDNFES